eukprot:COSAG05_NODE_794_length_7287_cov_45.558431_4_plen_104_part_00
MCTGTCTRREVTTANEQQSRGECSHYSILCISKYVQSKQHEAPSAAKAEAFAAAEAIGVHDATKHEAHAEADQDHHSHWRRCENAVDPSKVAHRFCCVVPIGI